MSHIIDSYSEANQSLDYSLYGSIPSGYITMAQSLTGDSSKITSSKIYLKKVGNPTGDAWVRIYAHAGVYGTSSFPTGLHLAVSGFLDVSTLTTSYQLISFVFSGANQVVLSNGIHYVISIEYIGGDIDNKVVVGIDDTSPSHSGNASYVVDGWWNYNAALDACFYIYGETVTVYPNGYLYRRLLMVDNAKVSGSSNFTDFTIRVAGTYPYLKTVANGGKVKNVNGYDIRFELADGTKLDHEIEYWNGNTGQFSAFVQIPTLYYGLTTLIYLYYGKSGLGASEENVAGTWSNIFDAVLHLTEGGDGTSDEYKDSTGNGNDGTGGSGVSGECPNQATGKDGITNTAQDFTGANHDHINLGDVLDIGTNDRTVIGLAYQDANTDMALVGKSRYASIIGRYTMGDYTDWKLLLQTSSGNLEVTDTGIDHSGAWKLFVQRIDRSGNQELIINDDSKGTVDISGDSADDLQSVDEFMIGHYQDVDGIGRHATFGAFDGKMDEIWVLNNAPTDDWLSTLYNSLMDLSNFYSVGDEETSRKVPKSGAINFQNPAIV